MELSTLANNYYTHDDDNYMSGSNYKVRSQFNIDQIHKTLQELGNLPFIVVLTGK